MITMLIYEWRWEWIAHFDWVNSGPPEIKSDKKKETEKYSLDMMKQKIEMMKWKQQQPKWWNQLHNKSQANTSNDESITLCDMCCPLMYTMRTVFLSSRMVLVFSLFFFPSSIFAALYAEEMCVYQPMPSAIWSPFVRALLVHSITDTHTHSYTHPHALLSHLIDDSRWILRLNWKWPIFGHADEPNLPLGFISLPDNISEI